MSNTTVLSDATVTSIQAKEKGLKFEHANVFLSEKALDTLKEMNLAGDRKLVKFMLNKAWGVRIPDTQNFGVGINTEQMLALITEYRERPAPVTPIAAPSAMPPIGKAEESHLCTFDDYCGREHAEKTHKVDSAIVTCKKMKEEKEGVLTEWTEWFVEKFCILHRKVMEAVLKQIKAEPFMSVERAEAKAQWHTDIEFAAKIARNIVLTDDDEEAAYADLNPSESEPVAAAPKGANGTGHPSEPTPESPVMEAPAPATN